jgi:hypothetical protein
VSDLRAREASSDEWDCPVVELVEEGRVVGYAYVDDDVLYTEFSPDEDGDAWAFEVADLQTALDTARAMLLPEGTAALLDPAAPADDTHPVDALAAEFDDRATFRGEEDEGFYPANVAARIIRTCETLGVAVVSLEGFRLLAGEPSPIPGMSVDTGEAHDGEPWPVFLAGCNVQAMGVLERWLREPGLMVALEVGDDAGERYVL